jgi:DNA polymerase-3 subunit alpha
MQFLNQILRKYPGQDGMVLYVRQSDGRKFRAELPLTVDSHNPGLFTELQQLFGRRVWNAAS